MCYDISLRTNMSVLQEYFQDLEFDSDIILNEMASIHIIGHAYAEHPVIYRHRSDEKLHCRLMEWGCIPFYVKDESAFRKSRTSMLNARSEKILEDSKSYWYKIRNRRCLIPVTGIYEHREIKGWKNKVPYFIRLREQPLFFIPGLYSVAELPDKETGEMIPRYTFTIITRGANEVMKMIHNGGDNKWRMPLFIPHEMAMQWLQQDLPLEEYKRILHFEMPSEELEHYPVYTIRTPKQRPDNKDKDALYEWDKLPELSLE